MYVIRFLVRVCPVFGSTGGFSFVFVFCVVRVSVLRFPGTNVMDILFIDTGVRLETIYIARSKKETDEGCFGKLKEREGRETETKERGKKREHFLKPDNPVFISFRFVLSFVWFLCSF